MRSAGAAPSDVLAVRGIDVDGDGRAELVLGIGPWHAYDVRVIETGSRLRLRSRLELGTVAAIEPITTARGRLLAAAKSDLWPSKVALLDGDHYGAPAGIHLLAWSGGRLTDLDRVPLVAPEGDDGDGRTLELSRLWVADLDGDRRDDLVARVIVPGHDPHVLVARQRQDGTFAPVLLGGVEALACAQLDDDPAAELVVRFPDDGGLWILGAGDQPAPAVHRPAALEPPGPRPAAAAKDPAVARMWTRAEDLAAMGRAEAAEVFDEIAELAGPVRDAARLRAGALWSGEGELDRAAERLEAAGVHDAHAVAQAATLRARLHEVDAAHALAARVADRRDASDEDRAAAAALLARLEPRAAPGVSMSFAAPLDPAWRILAPQALDRDLRVGALRVNAFGGMDRLAELPVRVVADWIRIAIDVDIDRTEWGSGVEVALVTPGGGPDDHIGVGVGAYGGGGIVDRRIGCLVPGVADPLGQVAVIDQVTAPASLTLTVDYVPTQSEVWCTVAVRGGAIVSRTRIAVQAALTPGPRTLVIRRGGDEAVLDAMWASVAIRRLALRGIALAPGPVAPLSRAHRLLIEGDAAGALAAYDGAPMAAEVGWAIGRAAALEALGRHGEAVTTVRAAHARGLAVEAPLWHLVRQNHRRMFAPLAAAVLGPAYVTRFATFWYYPLRMNRDDADLQALITGAVATPPVSTAAERHAAAMVLAQRGEAWWQLGHFAAVRADLEQAITLGAPLLDATLPPGAPPIGCATPRDAHVVLAAVAAASGDDAAALAHAHRRWRPPRIPTGPRSPAAYPSWRRDADPGLRKRCSRR